jgi:hypothetical protein
MEMPVGVVMRRQPGVTRWARWSWSVTGLLPGAAPADWRELRRDGEAVEYHAATPVLELHRADTPGYLASLSNRPPCAYVILRRLDAPVEGREFEVFGITASAYDAEEYMQVSDERVEPVPMPPALVAWVSVFVRLHHRETAFTKRRRTPAGDMGDGCDTGRGDPRIRQDADVYRSPTGPRRNGGPK